jgi:type II secretory pathway pseudopilin PulG
VLETNTKRNGFFITEMIVSLTILGMLVVGLAISLHDFAKFNLYQLVRQRCIAAGQAQLDCISSTGQPVSEEEFKKLWPKLDITIEQTDGAGQWLGLKLITVETKGMSFDTPVKVRLSRYITMQTPITEQEQ